MPFQPQLGALNRNDQRLALQRKFPENPRRLQAHLLAQAITDTGKCGDTVGWVEWLS